MNKPNPRKPRRQPVDYISFFEQVGRHNFTTDIDRYRDFNKVLIEGGATSEQCLRVLNEILQWCGMMGSPASKRPDGTVVNEVTYARIGKQDIGRMIYDVLTRVPTNEAPPEKTQSEE
jgi:hypothetical protein